MNILDKIIATKKTEVEYGRQQCPVAQLESSSLFNRKCLSFSEYIQRSDKSGIIAEFKRKSPSKGVINSELLLASVVKGYEDAGASAVSVLTDKEYFGGENKDLVEARTILKLPILRKDFIIDEYQIVEAKAIGADAILLIAAAMPPDHLSKLATFAKYLGMEVLMEVHNEEELMNNLHGNIDVIGVNNRNLKDFSENIDISIRLAQMIPDRYVRISESSINKAETIIKLKEYGYKGFLIGEHFMRSHDPGEGCRHLAESIKVLK